MIDHSMKDSEIEKISAPAIVEHIVPYEETQLQN